MKSNLHLSASLGHSYSGSLCAIPWFEARLELLGQSPLEDPLGDKIGVAIFGILVLGVAATVITALISIFVEKHKLGRLHAERLLDEIGRAHGFNYFQRRLIAKVAAKSKMAEPGLIMIFPSAFEEACNRIKPGRRQQQRLQFIREQLFGPTSATT